MAEKLKAVLVGLGQVSVGYADDPALARHFPVATHLQAIQGCERLQLVAAVDPDPAARRRFARHADADIAFADLADVPMREQIDVAIIACPPGGRLEALARLPNLRGVLVEKPLGETHSQSAAFAAACAARNISCQLNFLRRASPGIRALEKGGLRALIGDVQCGSAVYGNGLLNNGSHIIDLISLLCGQPSRVAALSARAPFAEGPIVGDSNVAFCLGFENNASIGVFPLRFANYREVGLTLWGTMGRLDLMQETLRMGYAPRAPNRQLGSCDEIPSDALSWSTVDLGDAFSAIYENLVDAVLGRSELLAPVQAGLNVQTIVTAIQHSLLDGCVEVEIAEAYADNAASRALVADASIQDSVEKSPSWSGRR